MVPYTRIENRLVYASCNAFNCGKKKTTYRIRIRCILTTDTRIAIIVRT